MKATVSEKGQVTIPKPLRMRLGLAPGVLMDFAAEGGAIVGRKRMPAEDTVAKWMGKGRLPAGRTVDEYLNRTRG